jgi:hypothetical protein
LRRIHCFGRSGEAFQIGGENERLDRLYIERLHRSPLENNIAEIFSNAVF